MNAFFLSSTWSGSTPSTLPAPTPDATAHHAKLPRPMRKTLRLAAQKPKRIDANNVSALPEAVDNFLRTEYRTDTDFLVNLEFLDRSYDHDEFGDVDNEYEGLTITDPMNEVELFQFCTGYDVL